MADHPRHRQPQVGVLIIVIVAAVPVGIGGDRLASHLVEGDGHGRVAHGGGQGNGGVDSVGKADCPLQNLHAAH